MPSRPDSKALQEKVMFLERDLEVLRGHMIDVWKRIESVERRVEHLSQGLIALRGDREGQD